MFHKDWRTIRRMTEDRIDEELPRVRHFLLYMAFLHSIGDYVDNQTVGEALAYWNALLDEIKYRREMNFEVH